MNRIAAPCLCVALALLLPSLAAASVGKVVLLEGTATRAPGASPPVALAVGSAIEVSDVIRVAKGNLKLKLNDESVIMLGEGSDLTINEAEFAGQERNSFVATLGLGKLWTKVTRAVSSSKFEVRTQKAVAGVRGTIFRIDSSALRAAASRRPKVQSVVAVTEGIVDVRAQLKAAAPGAGSAGPAKKGQRKEIAPPFSEVSQDQWEEKFTQLKANMKVTFSDDRFEPAPLDPKDGADAFGEFVNQQR